MKLAGIYKITSPSGRVYIGQSWNIKQRWYTYRSYCAKKQPLLQRSLEKHGAHSHEYEVLLRLPAICDQRTMDAAELFFIAMFCDRGVAMMNLMSGGFGGQHSEETKRKIGLKSKGRPPNKTSFKKGDPPQKRTKKWRMRISIANQGKHHSDSARAKICAKRALQVIKHSPETCRKISESQKGKPHNWASDDHKHFLGEWTRKNGNGRLGLVNSEESKQKVSETKRRSPTTPRGERHPQSRLTEGQVREIRRKFQPHIYTKRKLSAEYGISLSNVKAILSRKLWAHM